MPTVAALQAKTTELIAQFGETAVWKSRSTSYSTSTLTTSETVTEHSVSLVALASFNVQVSQLSFRANDTSIQENLTVYLSYEPLAFIPKIGDRVLIRSKEFTVSSMDEVWMSGTRVVYSFEVVR